MLKSVQNCNKCTFLDKLRAITQEGNLKTRQMTSFFHLVFLLCLQHSLLYLKIVKIDFHVVPLWSILVCKSPQFLAKATNLENHHTFIESKHPEVAKNSCYVLSPEKNQKMVSAQGLYAIIQSNPWNITFKVARKFYFMHCSHVVIIFLSTGLYKSVFSTTLEM